jgi:hypothetical protein
MNGERRSPPAPKERKNAAHGVSRGSRQREEPTSPEGRKTFKPVNNLRAIDPRPIPHEPTQTSTSPCNFPLALPPIHLL